MDTIYNMLKTAESKLIMETGHDYSLYSFLHDSTNRRDIMLVDNETGASAVKRISNFISFEDAYEILTTMVKELNKSAVIEPVSTILHLGIDIANNGDKPNISVCRQNGSAFEFINNITGDEAIELYKKLVGG